MFVPCVMRNGDAGNLVVPIQCNGHGIRWGWHKLFVADPSGHRTKPESSAATLAAAAEHLCRTSPTSGVGLCRRFDHAARTCGTRRPPPRWCGLAQADGRERPTMAPLASATRLGSSLPPGRMRIRRASWPHTVFSEARLTRPRCRCRRCGSCSSAANRPSRSRLVRTCADR